MEQYTQDLINVEPHLVQANGWKRFANFIIDYVIFIILAVIVLAIWELISPSYEENADYGYNNSGFALLENILYSVLYGLYISAFEMVTKGRTLGKLITGTKAVNEDGTTVTPATAFKRGFSRIVPFEIFSALGSPCYPWHDKWSNTYVIDIKASSILPPAEQVS
jgi:uncharacterized RDD family membrane protein YckC